MMANEEWFKNSEYYGMTKEEIKDKWEKKH